MIRMNKMAARVAAVAMVAGGFSVAADVNAPNEADAAVITGSNTTGYYVLETAMTQRGTGYSFGGSSPSTGFDCSGLTQWAAGKQGISLPRTASAQKGAVQSISGSSLRKGDLVFWHNSSGDIYHVGIYADYGKMLAATKPGDVVRWQNATPSSGYVSYGRL